MARAVRAVTVERGRDPRDLTLMAFGGNGGVHAPDLARQLGIPRVVVPPMSGIFSALGMLASDIEHTALKTRQPAARRDDGRRPAARSRPNCSAQVAAQLATRRLSGRAHRVPLGSGPAPRGAGDRTHRAVRGRGSRPDPRALRRRIFQDLWLSRRDPDRIDEGARRPAAACATIASTSAT